MINILVVEDHADTLAILVRLLRKQGYGVYGAASSEEAIGIVAARGCDLVISDVGLPGRNGLELMQDLKAQYGLKGIALTGHVFSSDQMEAERAGFDRFISKPIDFKILLAAIEDFVPGIEDKHVEATRIRREVFRRKLEGRD